MEAKKGRNPLLKKDRNTELLEQAVLKYLDTAVAEATERLRGQCLELDSYAYERIESHLKSREIDADKGSVGTLDISKAHIKQMLGKTVAELISVGKLTSDDVATAIIKAEQAIIAKAEVGNLKVEVGKAKKFGIKNLTAGIAKIKELAVEKVSSFTTQHIDADSIKAKRIRTQQLHGHVQADSLELSSISAKASEFGSSNIGKVRSEHIASELVECSDLEFDFGKGQNVSVDDVFTKQINGIDFNGLVKLVTKQQGEIAELKCKLRSHDHPSLVAKKDIERIERINHVHFKDGKIRAGRAEFQFMTVDGPIEGLKFQEFKSTADLIKNGRLSYGIVDGKLYLVDDGNAINVTGTKSMVRHLSSGEFDRHGRLELKNMPVNCDKSVIQLRQLDAPYGIVNDCVLKCNGNCLTVSLKKPEGNYTLTIIEV